MTAEAQKPEAQRTEVVVAQRAIEVAEIESQIATAKRYPRDIKVFKDKLMSMATLDQETAEGCYYALPRGGKAIDGPSIRLAEIALACYGNCVAEAHVTHEDDFFIYAVGSCRDLENNVSVRVEVRRRITKADGYICESCSNWHKFLPRNSKCMKCGEGVFFKKGDRYNDDMIAVTANAACAIALRNAVFKVVPGAFIKPVFDKVKETAVGKAMSLANRRAQVIGLLTKFGVTEDRVLAVISRRSVDEVTFDDVAKLIGLGTAIKDGETTVEEAFPPDFKQAQKTAAETIKQETGSEVVNAAPEPAPENPQDPPQDGTPAFMKDVVE